MKKILALFDTQVPYQINMEPIYAFAKDWKPDTLIMGGDIMDCEALQGLHHRSADSIDWDSIYKEIDLTNAMLNRLDRFHSIKEKHFWFGNHETRLDWFKQRFPKSAPIVPDLNKELRLVQRGYETHKQNELHPFGKLWVFHGDYYGTFHTRKNVTDMERSVLYGHVHTSQLYVKVNPVDSEPHQAVSAPCLCKKNPEWQEGRPNAWVNGFVTIYLHDDGNYNLYITHIINGRFYACNGKLY